MEVLEAPLIEHRVTFIKGTIMDEEALNRAGAQSAVAAFIFSDGCVDGIYLAHTLRPHSTNTHTHVHTVGWRPTRRRRTR